MCLRIFYPIADQRWSHWLSFQPCQPRTHWGLHNAFTRTVKELTSPSRRFEASTCIGQVFGLRHPIE